MITVSPLLPIRDPERFFCRISEAADRVVIDHFIEGDGTLDGSRTLKTPLPRAMKQVDEESIGLAYRERMVQVAQTILPGRVGVSIRWVCRPVFDKRPSHGRTLLSSTGSGVGVVAVPRPWAAYGAEQEGSC